MEIAIGLTIVNILALLSIKLYITSKLYEKAINYIFRQKNWEELSDKHLNKDKMFSDAISLTKWRYRDMFPGLEESRPE